MKMTINSIVRCTALISAFVAFAIQAADDPATHKKLKEEFQQAERVTEKGQAEAAAAQLSLDRLTRERTTWEAEVVRFKTDVATAQARLDNANKLGSATESDKANKDLSRAQSRLDTAQAELKKVDDQIQ